LIPCGCVMVLLAVVFAAVGVMIMEDASRWDPFYKDIKSTNFFIAAPAPYILGFTVTNTDVAFSYNKTVTLAIGDHTASMPLLHGAEDAATLQVLGASVELNKQLGLEETHVLTTQEARGGAAALTQNTGMMNATVFPDAVIKATLETAVNQQIALLPPANLTALMADGQRRFGGRLPPTQAQYDNAHYVPAEITCTNPNEAEMLVKSGTGKVYTMSSPTATIPDVEIGMITILGETNLKKDKPQKMTLGLKARMEEPFSTAFLDHLHPNMAKNPPSLGIVPLFMALGPLKSTTKATVLPAPFAGEVKKDDEIPDHFCFVLAMQHEIPFNVSGVPVMTPHLVANSPTFCRHSWAELMPLVTPELMAKYAAHNPANPLPDVPTVENQASAGFIDKFGGDPQKIADAEDELKGAYTVMTIIPLALAGLFLIVGISCMVCGFFKKKSGQDNHIAQAA